MKIQKFRASTASKVRQLVRHSLGDEAIILSTRQVRDQHALSRGERVEMTVAIDFDTDFADSRLEEEAPIVHTPPRPRPIRRPESSTRSQPMQPTTLPESRPKTSQPPTPRWAPTSEPSRPASHPVGHSTPAAIPASAVPVGPGIETTELSVRLDELRRLVQQLNANAVAPDELALEEVYRLLYTEMLANDVDGALAIRVVKAVRGRLQSRGDRFQVADAIQSTLERMLPSATGQTPKVLTLVGPTGVGKTTTAAKLAARAHLESNAVALVTCDAYRVAAVDQLRAYANALGAHFETAHGIEELDRALERCNGADTVILDTEGRGQRDLRPMEPLFEYLSKRKGVERHLVLSASTKPKDNSETVERFRIANPQRLIFTKVDETSSYGPILSESIRSQLPVSYLGTGQRVPEKLLLATPKKLAELAISAMG